MSSFALDVRPNVIDIGPGEAFAITITVTNTTALIDGYSVRAYGLDPQWVDVGAARLSLFPDATGTVEVRVQLPVEFPAGIRQISVHVQSENDPTEFALMPVTVDVAPRPSVAISVDPVAQTVGARAQFGLIVSNQGNSVLDVTPEVIDPEEQANVTLIPERLRLAPGQQEVVQATVRAPRPWLGQPKARVLEFGALAPARTSTYATVVQRPRIGRSLIALLGLILAAAVFAAVISRTLGNVVDQARVSSDVIDKALSDGGDRGRTLAASPGSIAGTVRAGASNEPVAGVEARLYRTGDPTSAVASAATSDTGRFTFTGLGEGTYRIGMGGAGFSDVWYPNGRTFVEGAEITLAQGQHLDLDSDPTGAGGAAGSGDANGSGGAAGAGGSGAGGTGTGGAGTDAGGAGGTGGTRSAGGAVTGSAAAGGGISLAGTPGVVSGKVDAPDPTGARATLVIEGIADPTVPAVVAAVDVSADGSFALVGVPTPQRYRLVVERSGNATETREITLGPGESRTDLTIRLRVGDGLITGRILGPGPIGGATIEATTGSTVVSTVSLTEGDIGSYALRDLPVPGVYTVTVSADGYAGASQIVVLDDGRPSAAQDIFLEPATGAVSGTVSAGGAPLGGATVRISGPDVELLTGTVSQGPDTGTYVFDDLPIPATYTVTFSKPGYLDQVRLVQLDPLQGTIERTDVNVALSPERVTVRGMVADPAGRPAALARVDLTDGVVSRTVLTATSPRGAFELTGIPAGAYTLSASLVGTEPVIVLVNVSAGQDVVDLGTLRLGAQASISGTVTWTGATPPTAQVRLYQPGQFPPAPGTTPVAVAALGPDGTYSFTGVEAPQTFVVAVFTDSAAFAPVASHAIQTAPGVAVTVDFPGVPSP